MRRISIKRDRLLSSGSAGIYSAGNTMTREGPAVPVSDIPPLRVTGPRVLLCAVALLLPHASAGAQEPDASLETCRKLQQKIERLDDRRQHGASASQMDRWKRQRSDLKDRFNALRCRHWGNRLR
ncbi:MAG: hypothetical protein CME43_04125 [Haliea sp.]|nr:hypothetical protein [Haliea sp.]|tara:strand:+ start:12271 stop:12645 length:375 start_codon:yes stop_codon:yes gene_type:complete